MIVMKGETSKNKISRDPFTVKKFDGSEMVMLEDQNGYAQMWLQAPDLELFSEKIEHPGGNVR